MSSTDHMASDLAGTGVNSAAVPLWVKAGFTVLVAVQVIALIASGRAAHLLWLCNVTQFGLVVAVWLENRLLASMMTLGCLLICLGWTVDFASGAHALGFVGFMFDRRIPLSHRALLLDHPLLAVFSPWLIARLGYDKRAPFGQIPFMAAVLVVSYLLTAPDDNINWVWGIGQPQHSLPPVLFLALVAAGSPFLFVLPAHILLLYTLGERRPAWLRSFFATPVPR